MSSSTTSSADASTTRMLLLNGSLSLISSIVSFIQMFVFLGIGVKRHTFLTFLFVSYGFFHLLYAICFIALSNDPTYLSGAGYASQEWIKYFRIASIAVINVGDMILTGICVDMWILVQFKNETYKHNRTLIQFVYILLSFFIMGGSQILAFQLSCIDDQCHELKAICYYPNDVCVLLLLFVGGPATFLFTFQLIKYRKESLNVLRQSHISPSLIYRMIVGLSGLIIFCVFSLFDIFPLTNNFPSIPPISFYYGALYGLALSIVFGSSSECLELWRDWIKKYLGIQLTLKNENLNSTMVSAQLKSNVAVAA